MSNFIELNDLPIYHNLLEEISDLIKTHNQICLTSPPGKENDFLYGIGSLKYDWSKSYVDETGKRFVPERTVSLNESDFTELCDRFKGTTFEVIYNSLCEKYVIGRMRIFVSYPNTCLSWHIDTENRIHFPIKTQEGCFMIIEDEVKHLEQNQWYYTKTVKPHTAFNGSKETRIHLVANILAERK